MNKKLNIYHYWNEIEDYFDIPNTESCIVFNQIIAAHQEENRHYHNLNHVAFLLKEIDKHHLAIKTRVIYLLVAFYHDVVYNTSKKDNEVKSAAILSKHFQPFHSNTDIIQQCVQIILDTKLHIPTIPISALFLDMDLAILGQSYSVYCLYKKNVKKEWKQYSLWKYVIGRKRFLLKTLKKNRLYHSKYYYDLLEKNARRNITKELILWH